MAGRFARLHYERRLIICFNIETKGMDSLLNNINNLQNALEDMSGDVTIYHKDVLTNKFLQKHTSFKNLEEFNKETGITQADIDLYNKNPEKLDKLIQNKSDFETFSKFILQAKLDKQLEDFDVKTD